MESEADDDLGIYVRENDQEEFHLSCLGGIGGLALAAHFANNLKFNKGFFYPLLAAFPLVLYMPEGRGLGRYIPSLAYTVELPST